MDCRDTRDSVDLLLDGELDEGARSMLEAHLAACSGCAARVRGERRVREALSAELGRGEPAPAHLRTRIDSLVRGPSRVSVAPFRERTLPALRGRTVPILAAAALAGLILVWNLVPRPGVQAALAAGLVEDHLERHGPSGEEDVVPAREPRALAAWFRRESGIRVVVPDAPLGGTLVGGQICIVDGEPVAHAVYDVKDRAVSYYAVPEADMGEGMKQGRVGDVNYVAWGSDPALFVLGSVPLAELVRFASRSSPLDHRRSPVI